MRVLIVGGGIIGLLCAVRCARSGLQVTVLDQGPLPNASATSHDRSRVLRALHPGDADATRTSVAAHHAWSAVESLLGTRCYRTVGALSLVSPDQVGTELASLASAGVPADGLAPAELADRYRHLVFPAGLAGVLEEHAGVLLADRVLAAAVRWLRGQPDVRLREGQRVAGVDAAARSVLLDDGSVLRGDRVLLAAGPWSRRLLPPEIGADLVLNRQTMLYCRTPDSARPPWAGTPAIPAFGTGYGAWLVPPVGSAPLKLSSHEACRTVPDVTDHASDAAWITGLATRFEGLIRGFGADWITSARDCYYLDDPATGGPSLVDLADGEVLAFAACGGGAFKQAPLIAAAITARFAGETVPRPASDRSTGHGQGERKPSK